MLIFLPFEKTDIQESMPELLLSRSLAFSNCNQKYRDQALIALRNQRFKLSSIIQFHVRPDCPMHFKGYRLQVAGIGIVWAVLMLIRPSLHNLPAMADCLARNLRASCMLKKIQMINPNGPATVCWQSLRHLALLATFDKHESDPQGALDRCAKTG